MQRLAILLCLLAGGACDLLHLEQRMYCESAQNDRDKCEARPDWCDSYGGPICVGAACSGRFCGPDATSKTCVVTSGRCPVDGRFIAGELVVDLSRYPWKAARLSAAAQSLSESKLTREVIETLGLEDRRELCGAHAGDACELGWDEAQGYARCMLIGDVCAQCIYREEPYRCTARNLCSGVICP